MVREIFHSALESDVLAATEIKKRHKCFQFRFYCRGNIEQKQRKGNRFEQPFGCIWPDSR